MSEQRPEPCCQAHRIMAEFALANGMDVRRLTPMLAGMLLATRHPEYAAALVQLASHVDEPGAERWADDMVRDFPIKVVNQ